ncbi:unnamed protein product, partial [marine sediment metagenome]
DLNDIEFNSMYAINATNVTNEPTDFLNEGFLTTYRQTSTGVDETQIIVGMSTANYYKQWMRHKKAGSWNGWKLIIDGGALSFADGNASFTGDVVLDGGFLNAKHVSNLTIAAGAITVSGTKHSVGNEGAAATDNLDTINGGSTYDIIILTTKSNAEDVIIRHGVGNIHLAGGLDFTLGNVKDNIMLFKYETGSWSTMSSSNNV